MRVEITLVRVKITHMRVEITHMRVEITLERVKITLMRVEITRACQNHTHACGNHTRACVLKNWACLSKNIFKNRHAGVWISHANVSFSQVCVSNFFVSVFACRIDTPFLTVYQDSGTGYLKWVYFITPMKDWLRQSTKFKTVVTRFLNKVEWVKETSCLVAILNFCNILTQKTWFVFCRVWRSFFFSFLKLFRFVFWPFFSFYFV
jgi:hypothetical protein